MRAIRKNSGPMSSVSQVTESCTALGLIWLGVNRYALRNAEVGWAVHSDSQAPAAQKPRKLIIYRKRRQVR